MSPAVAALLGAALGIVGSIVTTALTARYAAKSRAEERADARAKERRDTLIALYVKAVDMYFALEHADSPLTPEAREEIFRQHRLIMATIRIIGSSPSVQSWAEATTKMGNAMMGKGSKDEASTAFVRFIKEAKADIEGWNP